MKLPPKAQQLIKERLRGVISSTNRYGHPESALVTMALSDKGEVVFGTDMSTRKYQNILENRRVSIVFDLDKVSIQIEGDARPIPVDEADKYTEVLFTVSPGSRKHAENPGQRYVVVAPDWARWVDYSGKPMVEEYGDEEGVD